jgi:hypothetical protein
MLRRMHQSRNPVHRRAAAAELFHIRRLLREGSADGRVVQELRVVASGAGARTPDLVATYTDGTIQRFEITTHTDAPRGVRETGPTATRAETGRLAHESGARIPFSEQDLVAAIERKVDETSQLRVPMGSTPRGGVVVVHLTHARVTTELMDRAVATASHEFESWVHGVDVSFTERGADGALHRITRSYRRTASGTYSPIEH